MMLGSVLGAAFCFPLGNIAIFLDTLSAQIVDVTFADA